MQVKLFNPPLIALPKGLRDLFETTEAIARNVFQVFREFEPAFQPLTPP